MYVHYSQTNGLAVRCNGTLKAMLCQVAMDNPKQWAKWLPPLLFPKLLLASPLLNWLGGNHGWVSDLLKEGCEGTPVQQKQPAQVVAELMACPL